MFAHASQKEKSERERERFEILELFGTLTGDSIRPAAVTLLVSIRRRKLVYPFKGALL